jgi:hypothetical protein
MTHYSDILVWLVVAVVPLVSIVAIIFTDAAREDGFRWNVEKLSTIAITIATVLGVYVARLQWIALTNTDEKVGRQLSLMEADQRPWVKIAVAQDQPFSLRDAGMGVKVTLTNTGKSPAHIRRTYFHDLKSNYFP